MRLPVDVTLIRPAGGTIAACMAFGLVACANGSGDLATPPAAIAVNVNGPQADYPVVVGPSYVVNGVEHTPVDQLNYDEVGVLAVDPSGEGVNGGHHTLPLPSYVEVTSLETGRTILVRLERRGPMNSNDLLSLTPAAMDQLGASSGEPVRVRRVNPPEEERVLLRSGQAAPLRMDTPMSLVTVLRRKLPEWAPAAIVPAPLSSAAIAQRPETANQVTAEAQNVGSGGQFLIQAATFSTEERATRIANALGGSVLPSGKYFRVRVGPFLTRGEAEASLANVKSAGYSDARILISG